MCPSAKSLIFLLLINAALWSCSSNAGPDEVFFERAHANGLLANEGFRRCLNFTHAWLLEADSATGLFPENLYRGNDTWNAHNSAADNYPFMVLTSLLLDRDLAHTTMLDMLQTERKLTSRINSLPDDYSLSKKDFTRQTADTGRIIFGTSEYIKDGLIPLTEYAGITPWSERMMEMLDDLSGIVRVAHDMSETGSSKPIKDEINGELLQTLSRVYWMTGDDRYLEWALEIGDHYLLGMDLHHAERIRLRDHGCEIIAGLSELYLITHFKYPEKKDEYQPPLFRVMDRILEVARNEDGMFFNEANLKTGEVLDSGIVDNWGYIYNAYYTVYLLDQKTEYRQAVIKPLNNLNQNYRNYNWENGSADGFADAIESGINLYNRERIPELEQWISSEIGIMWSLQDSSYQERALPWKGSGIIEGWHGDGNFAWTSLMYCLWKTSGLTIEPWREDVIFGTAVEGETLYIFMLASDLWEGVLKFEGERHLEILHLPLDYPRINQFPEWYTVQEHDRYEVRNDIEISLRGQELKKGLKIKLEKEKSLSLEIRNIDQ